MAEDAATDPAIHAELESEWVAWCEEQKEDWRKENVMPCIAHFYSGGAFFDAFEEWQARWRKYIERLGRQWWLDRGFVVTSWPRSKAPITVGKILDDPDHAQA